MKPIGTLFVSIPLLLITAHQLPAPIVEEEKQTPAPTESAQPKSKRERSKAAEVSSDSGAALKFDGTWRTTNTQRYAEGSIQEAATLVVDSGRKAEFTGEGTFTLASGKVWPAEALAPPYNKLSPISTKWMGESTDLKVQGQNLTIRWPPSRLVAWTPKNIPRQVLEKSNDGSEVTYILDGARLISTTGKRSTIWHRVQ